MHMNHKIPSLQFVNYICKMFVTKCACMALCQENLHGFLCKRRLQQVAER